GREEGLPGRNPWFAVSRARTVDDALALPLDAYGAVVLNAAPEEAAEDALAALRARTETAPVALCVASLDGTNEASLRAAGADRVLVRGRGQMLGPHALEAIALLARQPRRGPRRADGAVQFGALRSRSPAMQETLRAAERAAASGASVLIRGETGTGKELLARAVHDGSDRAREPFVALNCAALPDTLLESELFGHVRGAFTGADRDREGLFEAAEGGTLFLDEIGEMPVPLQAKLLRAVQDGEIRPVGGSETREIDTRIVAATHRDLRTEVSEGRFRRDLYYRLAVLPLTLPPLRERRPDILPLARALLYRHGETENKPGCSLSRGAGDLLLAHAWPGNIRELENELQRALTWVEPGGELLADHFSDTLRGDLHSDPGPGSGQTLRERVERYEAWVIRRELEHQDQRKAATARTLGLTREGLYKKMKRLGID
ncbi:MAG: hypothetical protein GWN37_07230, partial [Gammaproteobacteria bacterium]|nr:hypothetical protein [Gammaproteobacteria bacterium]